MPTVSIFIDDVEVELRIDGDFMASWDHPKEQHKMITLPEYMVEQMIRQGIYFGEEKAKKEIREALGVQS